MLNTPYFYDYGYKTAFLANMADRLSDAICQQTAALNKSAGSVTPVRSVSSMLFLLENGATSLMDISRALDYSHQLTSLRIAPLEKLGLIERKTDANDKRRRLIELTSAGKKDAEILKNLSTSIASDIEQRFKKMDNDLMNNIEEMIVSIQRDPLGNNT